MEPFSWFGISADASHHLARALVLGIIVSSEAVLARQRRTDFEGHLLLFSAFCLLMAGELFSVIVGIIERGTPGRPAPGIWVWGPILRSIGWLGVAFCFDFVRGGGHRGLRGNSRHYLFLAAVLFTVGALLTAGNFNTAGAPTSVAQLGRASFLLHGIQLGSILLLASKAIAASGRWLSALETRMFLLGCLAGVLGALAQVLTGPREHFTTLAFTVCVAVILRGNYRRRQIEAVRASEDRSAKTLLLHRITTQLKSTFELQRLYEILMDSLISNLGAESGAIYIRGDHDSSLRPVLVHGPFPPPMPLPDWCPEDRKVMQEVVNRTEVPLGEGIVGRVAKTGTPNYIHDESGAARYYTWNTGFGRVHTAVALPLRSPEGVYGVVQIVNRGDGTPFGEEDLRFMSLLVEQAGLAIYNARLHAEIVERQRTQEQIKIAQQIQQRLIPSDLPEIPGIAIGTEYRAAQEVGGDYFDVYRIDHDHLGLLVFDVAGKGVPGALLMAITSTFLKMAAPRATSPAWVLNEVNAALSAEIRRGLFVTVAYGVLELSSRRLTLCCAGHPEALIIRETDLSCESHKPRGAAMGLLKPNRFRRALEQETIQLDPGDTVLLYTDGIIEAMNDDAEEFGKERLCKACRRFMRKGPRRVASEIINAVSAHAGQQPQYDDMTVLALRVIPDDGPPQGGQEGR